jgi:lipoprotein LpqS
VTLGATYGPRRLRSAIAIMVTVWMFVGVAGCCYLVRSEGSELSPAQAFSTSLTSEFALNADHASVDCAASPACPQAFAMAALPPSATALVALAIAVVVATVVGSVANRVAPTRRAPPSGVLVALTGQDVLTRLCLARR